MRYFKLLLIAVLSVVMLTGWNINAVYADEPATTPAPQYKVYIVDKANLLTPAEMAQLKAEMEELTPYGNMIFYTDKLAKGANYEKHSENTYYKLCGNQPGVIFQIDMGNRKLTLSSSTAMDDILRSERDSIVDNVYLMATHKNYYKCASEVFRQIKVVINDGEIAHEMKHINNGILALVLGLIVNFLIICWTSRTSVRKEKKQLLGNMLLNVALADVLIREGHCRKVYEPRSKGSSGGGFSSGGGGGGGGGFSGGSSSHGF